MQFSLKLVDATVNVGDVAELAGKKVSMCFKKKKKCRYLHTLMQNSIGSFLMLQQEVGVLQEIILTVLSGKCQ